MMAMTRDDVPTALTPGSFKCRRAQFSAEQQEAIVALIHDTIEQRQKDEETAYYRRKAERKAAGYLSMEEIEERNAMRTRAEILRLQGERERLATRR